MVSKLKMKAVEMSYKDDENQFMKIHESHKYLFHCDTMTLRDLS